MKSQRNYLKQISVSTTTYINLYMNVHILHNMHTQRGVLRVYRERTKGYGLRESPSDPNGFD